MSLRTLVEAALTAIGGDVKGLSTRAMQPPIGSAQPPVGMTGSATNAPAYQRQHWVPVDVGPTGWTADAIMLNVTTVYSGATIPTALVGLYGSDPATGYPKTDAPLASGSVALSTVTTTGIKFFTFTSPVALTPGRYWMSFLLAGAAVATAGGFTAMGSTAVGFPTPAGTGVGTNIRSLYLAGQTALLAAAQTPSGFLLDGGSSCPFMLLRRSA